MASTKGGEHRHGVITPSEALRVVDVEDSKEKDATDISQIERDMSPEELEKDHMNYDRVDKELVKYANVARIDISEAENKRLKRLIDKRVLPIMIFTYFLQALDKGTLSFASIMGIKTDAHLVGQQVRDLIPSHSTSLRVKLLGSISCLLTR